MSQVNKVPAIRFKGFRNEWEDKTLGDLGSVSMNKRIFKDQTSETGDVPFYKIGTFGGAPDAYIPKGLFDEYRRKYPYPSKGDLLISASGSIGRVVEYSGRDEYFQDSNIVWLQHDTRLVNSFLKQFYSFVKWGGLEGSTIKRLYNKDILDTKISIPAPTEQTRIGSYFQYFDELISLHQTKVNKLTNLKKAMLEKMFPKKGKDVPEIRFKGFVGAWDEKSISNVAMVRTGLPFDSNQFSDDGEFLVITNGNIQNESPYVYNAIGNRINITNETIIREYVLTIDDILITMDGTVGRTAMVVNDKLILAQRVGRLTANSSSKFLYYLLNAGAFYESMTLLASGGTIKHISLNDIACHPIKIPKLVEEERKIGEYFHDLDKLITVYQTELEKLNNLKKACLEKMFV